MDQFFLVILLFLSLLASFHLFVGISNDAVNFLNSAVGSRIASFRTILIVASLGVLIGATFSSGMMEIARSGVFNPQMFTFREIMIIFFAVIISDVLLIDRFNSLGLPTSTTVSLVFDLLGGAVAAAAIKIWHQNGSFLSIVNYINNEKAISIISGILISVVVAFIAGTIVQFITRLIFTFQYEKAYRRIGGIFGGIAITAVFYFLVMKGAKGASFMNPDYLAWINEHTGTILISFFAVSSIIFQLMIVYFNANIFKIVILSGTFSLAFAFAGNDLVNFVGVPLAAFDSYMIYQNSGLAPDVLTMASLKNPVQTPTVFLLLAGLVMVLALCFSKKAKRVIQTALNLSSSANAEQEQFGSSLPGRLIVRSTLGLGKILHQILPNNLFTAIDKRMEKQPLKPDEIELPFDHIRASVNLVVASILIASATSLKLPLSTTYVTFMVAMGSSFADGAWDRESAVYRISGVLAVIAGWFLSALCAFTLSAINASIVFLGGNIAVFVLMALTLFVIVRSNFIPKKVKNTRRRLELKAMVDQGTIQDSLNLAVSQNLKATAWLYKKNIIAFLREDERHLQRLKSDASALYDDINTWRNEYYRMAKQGSTSKQDSDARHFYYRVFTNMREVSQDLKKIVNMSKSHVSNQHRVYKGILKDNLMQMLERLDAMQKMLSAYPYDDTIKDIELSKCSDEYAQYISQLQMQLLYQIDEEQLSLRGSELYLSFLQFARESVNRYTLVALMQRELNNSCRQGSEQKNSNSEQPV